MYRVFLCAYPALCKIMKALIHCELKKFPVSTLVPPNGSISLCTLKTRLQTA